MLAGSYKKGRCVSMYRFETPKDVSRFIRSVIELLILLALLFVVLKALLVFSVYEPYNKEDKTIVSGNDMGFLALSYIGVDREGTETLISTQKLDEQLGALHDLGYVTISQQDVINYYNEGKPLPEKALFLMFEDGRNDTAIYAQSIMEKYNDKATMFTYAEKFRSKDSHFLMPNDLKGLEENGFWEIGSNGYRLSYINVFDRYDRFIGELKSTEYAGMMQYFGRDYTHYLMDYIRDEKDLPVESYAMMKERILGEYSLMRSEYTQGIGKVPQAYTLLHSNTGAFGENDKVSAVNEEGIRETFAMNFNREGFSMNDRESSIYDLTRMQPQSNWYTNHLLMRIKYDLPEDRRDEITFVEGDSSQNKYWAIKKGAVEYKEEKLVLTSEPEDCGLIKICDGEAHKNINFSAILGGNKLGYQSVILRADDEGNGGIEVVLFNNHMYLKQDGEIIADMDLYDFDEIPKISVEEDKRDTLAGEYGALAKNAVSDKQSTEYKKLKKEVENTQVKSVEEGAEEYRPELQLHDLAQRKIEIVLNGDKISVGVDGKALWTDIQLAPSNAGSIFLKSAWAEYEYSQRNIADDVYDGVFEKMNIVDTDKDKKIYSNLLEGTNKAKQTVIDVWNGIINWFIKNI